MKRIHKEDIKEYLKKTKEYLRQKKQERKEKREAKLEARRNSAFYKRQQQICAVMNKISLLLHAVLACGINFIIEALSRHSAIQA